MYMLCLIVSFILLQLNVESRTIKESLIDNIEDKVIEDIVDEYGDKFKQINSDIYEYKEIDPRYDTKKYEKLIDTILHDNDIELAKNNKHPVENFLNLLESDAKRSYSNNGKNYLLDAMDSPKPEVKNTVLDGNVFWVITHFDLELNINYSI